MSTDTNRDTNTPSSQPQALKWGAGCFRSVFVFPSPKPCFQVGRTGNVVDVSFSPHITLLCLTLPIGQSAPRAPGPCSANTWQWLCLHYKYYYMILQILLYNTTNTLQYNFAYTCPPPPCRFTPDHPHQQAGAPTSVTRVGVRGKNVHQLNASNEFTIGPPHKADCAHRIGILHLLIVI